MSRAYEYLFTTGIVMVVIGFIIMLFSVLLPALKTGESSGRVKFSFIGFIGPFPFGISNDRKLLYLSLLIAGLVILYFLITTFQGRR